MVNETYLPKLRILLPVGVVGAVILFLRYNTQYGYVTSFQETSKGDSQKLTTLLVDTKTCKIMEMNPFDPSVLRFIKDIKSDKCPPGLIVSTQKVLVYNQFHEKYNSSFCCFNEIHRVGEDINKYDIDADNKIRITSNCTPISKSGVTLPTSEFLQIVCQDTANGTVTKSTTDYHALVFSPEKHSEITKLKSEYWKKQRDSNGLTKKQSPPSVLILGIDSVSRMNMMRSLRKTRDFLERNDFVEMKGYTKIGENTFPNMMGALGGMKNYNYPCVKGKYMMDHCPLIWKSYNRSNYATALVEDAPRFAIFNFRKVGFVEQPVDYYLRTLSLGYDKDKGSEEKKGCINGMTQSEFMMNYIRDFVKKQAASDVPYFLLSWFTSLAHNDINALKPAEPIFYNMLEDLIADESFNGNNTVILFISDHGSRVGPYRETFIGYYEESLPFFFIRLPPHLKASHPHWYQNLKKNSNRLTSPLDLHATLEDVLSLSSSPLSGFNYTHSNWEPNFRPVYSFFEDTPLNRTCRSSGIPEEYCRCGVKPSLSKESDSSKKFGKAIVSSVNKILAEQIRQDLCISLKFQKVLYARELQVGSEWNSFGKFVNFTEHLVAVEASPSRALFEGRVRVFEDENTVITGDISRINKYGEQSKCLADPKLVSYCYCRDYHIKAEAEKQKKKPKSKG